MGTMCICNIMRKEYCNERKIGSFHQTETVNRLLGMWDEIVHCTIHYICVCYGSKRLKKNINETGVLLRKSRKNNFYNLPTIYC